MSYMALARKWRPRTFSQLRGQDHVSNTLMKALNQQRLHHAYLFTGTRGVGKTSVARILAKALNCERGISSEPCLECSTCVAIEQGRFMDLIEIDGASKTRVEDTRELLDNVQYAPTSGRFKIYLIDEVHMLSNHSFNALLKTLEEPPEHVKFILATTDPQKVPVTILSRCLQFNLKHVSNTVICQQLEQILKDEQLQYEPDALELLAQAARGSMRDALSLLDQAISASQDILSTNQVKQLLGYTSQDYALQLLTAIKDNMPADLLAINQSIAKEGEHYYYVLDEVITYLHQIAIHQSLGATTPLLSPNETISNLAQAFSAEDVQLFYQIALKGREELHLAPSLCIGFSMTMLRMLTFKPAPRIDTPAAFYPANSVKTPPLEAPVKQTTPAPVPLVSAPAEQTAVRTEPKVQAPADIKPEQWIEIIPKLKLSGFAHTAVENSEFVSKSGRDLNLRVAKGHLSLFTPSTISRIEAALTDFFESPVKLQVSAENALQASPAQQKNQLAEQKQQDAEAALTDDPVFQQLKSDFSAELIKNSIVPLKNEI